MQRIHVLIAVLLTILPVVVWTTRPVKVDYKKERCLARLDYFERNNIRPTFDCEPVPPPMNLGSSKPLDTLSLDEIPAIYTSIYSAYLVCVDDAAQSKPNAVERGLCQWAWKL